MQTEVARLKQENPDMPHKDRYGTGISDVIAGDRWLIALAHRFKLVIDNWNKQKESK